MLSQEFYIPVQSSSIHFLKTKLCVGCTNGFEIVDLETLDTQGLLDPADLSLDFVRRRENLRPLAIYRIDNEFLLCYDGAQALFHGSHVIVHICFQNLRSMSTRVAGDHAKTSWSTGKDTQPVSVCCRSF